MLIDVNVLFRGTVRVKVPDGLSVKDATILAQKKAIACIVANIEESEAEEVAMEEYEEETGSTSAEEDWDETSFHGVGGCWQIEAPAKMQESQNQK